MKVRLPINYHLLQKTGRDSLEEKLNQFLIQGYDELEVVSVFMTSGFEFSRMKRRVRSFKNQFKKISFTKPVLYGRKKTIAFADFLIEEYNLNDYDNYVFVGHGLPGSGNYEYRRLLGVFRRRGFTNVQVAMLKGRSWLDVTLLAERGVATVIPLLISCGKHVREDILGEKESFCSALEDRGISVVRKCTSLDMSGRFEREFLV